MDTSLLHCTRLNGLEPASRIEKLLADAVLPAGDVHATPNEFV